MSTTIVIVLLMAAGWPTVEVESQNVTDRSITIYKAECPTDYTGDASADECDGNPIAGVPFRVGRPYSGAFSQEVSTNIDGLVTLDIPELSSDGVLRVIEILPIETERFVAYCVDDAGVPLGISYPDDIGNFALGAADVQLSGTGNVACDWYNVPSIQQTQEARTPSPARASQEANTVDMTDEPNWWVVPFAPGYGNTEEGRLYFGVHVGNQTRDTVHVGISFRAYEADGTPFFGCNAPGGDGPGVSTTIAPGEEAFLTCSRTIVPRTLDGLQITARLWDIEAVPRASAAFEVLETVLNPLREQSSPTETIYDASALVRVTSNRDTDVSLLLRFYDVDGVQVGTCETVSVSVEPEVEQRITCSFPVILDTTSPQPVSVQAEPLPGRS